MLRKFSRSAFLCAACCAATVFLGPSTGSAADASAPKPQVAKKVINLAKTDALRLVEPVGVHPYNEGFVETDGVYVVADKKFALFLDGTKIDFLDTPTAKGFNIDNPNFPAGAGCAGCGH